MDIASTLQSQQAQVRPTTSGAEAQRSTVDSASVTRFNQRSQGGEQDPSRSPQVEQRLEQALQELSLPTDSFRMELNYSKDTGRVIARVLDKDTGDVMREIPSKELQRLFSQMREFLGAVVDEQA